jgi:hypothetical protein
MTTVLYGIDNPYFTQQFSTIQELIQAVIDSGADPNCRITRNGVPTPEELADLISA